MIVCTSDMDTETVSPLQVFLYFRHVKKMAGLVTNSSASHDSGTCHYWSWRLKSYKCCCLTQQQLHTIYYYTSCGACTSDELSCLLTNHLIESTAGRSAGNCPSLSTSNPTLPLSAVCLSPFTKLISYLPSNQTEPLTATIIPGVGWSKVSSVSQEQAWILSKDYS